MLLTSFFAVLSLKRATLRTLLEMEYSSCADLSLGLVIVGAVLLSGLGCAGLGLILLDVIEVDVELEGEGDGDGDGDDAYSLLLACTTGDADDDDDSPPAGCSAWIHRLHERVVESEDEPAEAVRQADSSDGNK